MTNSVSEECNNQLDEVETGCDEIETIPISYAIEVNRNELNEIQYAIPCNNNNNNNNRQVAEKKEIILNINKTTLCLCFLNLPYVFKNFGFYIIRVGTMMMCQYYGVFKCNECVLNIYIGETLVSLFLIRPLLLFMWYHYNSFFILSFEFFQIPFEIVLMIQLNTLRKKINEQNIIPLASHNEDNIVYVVNAE